MSGFGTSPQQSGSIVNLSAESAVNIQPGNGSLGSQYHPIYTQPSNYGATAFGEQRVANPYTLSDLVNKYEIDTFKYDWLTQSNGAVAHVLDESAIRISVGANAGSRSCLRTNTYYSYQVGKGLRAKITCYHPDKGKAHQVRRWGFFDEENGPFFEVSGTNVNLVLRSKSTGTITETRVSQSVWNYDKLDGNGPSGEILDITKGNIYEVSFQWLGVGDICFFVSTNLVHKMVHHNLLPRPYMTTAVLPLSWEVQNMYATEASNFTYICGAVTVDGGEEAFHQSHATYNQTDVSVTTSEKPLLIVRPTLNYPSSSEITNRSVVIPNTLQVSTEGVRAGYRLVINPATITGGDWLSVNVRSCMEENTGSSAITGGETVYRGFLPNTNDSATIDLDHFFHVKDRKLRLSAFTGSGADPMSRDTLVIMAITEQAGNSNMRASLAWGEYR